MRHNNRDQESHLTGKPDAVKAARPVWGEVGRNLPQKCGKALPSHSITILALHVIRTPQAEEERKPDLRLRKVRSSDELTRDRVPRRLPAVPYEEQPC